MIHFHRVRARAGRVLPAVRLSLLPVVIAALLLTVLFAAACQPRAAEVSQAPTVQTEPIVVTSEPTATPETLPTETPAGTATFTPTPTDTATPTLTPTATATKVPKSITETENILVMGIDPRPGDLAWRTDTIMVVALDYDANQVGIVSIQRDLWVDIPGYGMGRINQADFEGEKNKYPGGGPALLGKVIQDNLGIPTKHWVRIKQEGLVQLVDALGGVTVTLDCPLHELTPHPSIDGEYVAFDLPAGQVLLDGAAAKKFATYRYNSNDFYRGKRQQQLIWAIRDRALQLDVIPRIPDLWRALADTFKTDLSVLDVIRLARIGANLQANQVHGLVFSTDAIEYAEVGGAQVLRIKDPDLIQQGLSQLFASTPIQLQGREGSGKCPATPTPTSEPIPTMVPLATYVPTATATATATN